MSGSIIKDLQYALIPLVAFSDRHGDMEIEGIEVVLPGAVFDLIHRAHFNDAATYSPTGFSDKVITVGACTVSGWRLVAAGEPPREGAAPAHAVICKRYGVGIAVKFGGAACADEREARLRKILEPFVKAADNYADCHDDRYLDADAMLTVGDLREFRAFVHAATVKNQ